jgi:hypothetical protein
VPDSDTLYHQLFSHPRLVEDLVREFVPEALAAGLGFSGLQRVNPKFHIGRRSARRRESDVIWRLPCHEGSDIYLYLLIEFQSKSDWWMAVRTQIYQGLLWQQIIAEKKLKPGARLPPLLLVVLYNGVRPWNAVTNIHELIALSPDSPLWPWQPQVRYYLLDMSAFPRDDLMRRTSVAALLFRLERRSSTQEIEELGGEVVGWLRRQPDCGELRRLFTELVRQAYVGLGITGAIPEDLLEMKPNLVTLAETSKRQWLAEGEAKGKAKGKAEGKAEALVCLLAERFGAINPSLLQRIRAADLTTVECWFKRAIVAPDLPSIFAQPR